MAKIVPGPVGLITYEEDLAEPVDLSVLFDLGTPVVRIYTESGQVLSIAWHHDQSAATSDAFIVVCAELAEVKILGSSRNDEFEPPSRQYSPFETSRTLCKGDPVIGDDRAKSVQWSVKDDSANA